MRRLYTIDEFAKLPDQQRDAESMIATTSMVAPEFGESGRIVRYTFSTPAVGRDLHTVAPEAWQLDNFAKNPVFLWFHDDSQPPIGRVIDIGDVNGALKGSVEYAEPDLSPFADMIYRMVKARYINAVSTSWQPLAWSFSREKARPGGVDFTKVDLLEISQVPIPALPGALAEARSNGIDTSPLYSWAERLLDTGGMTLVPRDELENLRRASKMPARTSDPGQTDAAKTAAEALKAKHARAIARAPKVPVFKRGLYEVAQLAYLLEQLGYCHSCSEYEAALEGDESPVPSMLAEALVAFAAAFKAAATQEADELLEAHEAEEEGEEAVEEVEIRALTPEEKAFIAAGATPRARAWRAGIAVARAGKALSASNGEKLQDAQAHHERALKHHRSLNEHHEAVSEHLKEARAAHGEASDSLKQAGEHVRAAQEEPEKAPEHLKRAAKAQEAAGGHLDDADEAHGDLADRHEDVGDSNRAMGRCVKSAQRCVRSVTDGAATSEPDSEGADDLENDEKAKEEKARRQRRARALQLREHVA